MAAALALIQPSTPGKAAAAEAVFQGIVTCSFSAGTEFSSPVTATVRGGMLMLEASDRLWTIGTNRDFTRRQAESYIVFEQSSRFGKSDFFFAGATSHIRVLATSEAVLAVKPDGGITVCSGALALTGGSLAAGLAR